MKIEKIERINGTSKKTGKPYVMVLVTCDGVKYSCFETSGITDKWTVGQDIDYPTEKNGNYNNIRLPKRSDAALAKLDEILANTKQILEALSQTKGTAPF